jgi:NitT/TauT family transport system ATP-binding protein
MTAPPPSTIDISNVTHRFNGQLAVDDLSLAVAAGETVALVGRTGAGKSTALHLVMGTIAPHAGTVRVAGVDPCRDVAALRGKLAISFQNDRLLPWRTAVENVAFGLEILGHARSDCRRRARDWLARVKMAGAEEKYAHELSGGMRQRVSLARALAVDPAILLLDESFSQLDHVTSQELRRDVSRLIHALGKTCLFVTHRIDDAIEMADRVVVVRAPARVALEVRPSDAVRGNPERAARLHDDIAAALGGDERTLEST